MLIDSAANTSRGCACRLLLGDPKEAMLKMLSAVPPDTRIQLQTSENADQNAVWSIARLAHKRCANSAKSLTWASPATAQTPSCPHSRAACRPDLRQQCRTLRRYNSIQSLMSAIHCKGCSPDFFARATAASVLAYVRLNTEMSKPFSATFRARFCEPTQTPSVCPKIATAAGSVQGQFASHAAPPAP